MVLGLGTVLDDSTNCMTVIKSKEIFQQKQQETLVTIAVLLGQQLLMQSTHFYFGS